DDARRMNIGPIPALRIIGHDGHTISSRDGFQTAGKLLAWLESAGKKSDGDAPFDLKEIKDLNKQTLERLVSHFDDRDVTVREALIRRLSAEKALAAIEVVDAFSRGNLATRLSALELLVTWKAPIKDADPWQPESITESLLTELEDWATETTASELPA